MNTATEGQIWSDKDKRRNRTVTVIATTPEVIQVKDNDSGKVSVIQRDRFEKRWNLEGSDELPVEEVTPAEEEPKKVYAKGNREAWLEKAAGVLKKYVFIPAGYDVPEIRVSVGWPGGRGKKEGVVGQCFATSVAGDEIAQIFISPVIETSYDAIETLAHEMIHAIDNCESGHKKNFIQIASAIGFAAPWKSTPATDELRETLEVLLKKLSDYPHAPIKLKDRPTVQKTYMLKAQCSENPEYFVRLTQKKVDDWGLPLCPCHQQDMELTE